MSRLVFLPALGLVVLLSAGCDDAVQTTAPEFQSQSIRGGDQRLITMQDTCDPETFNEAVGPGTCLRNGGVRFTKFLQLLGQHQKVGAWMFAPTAVNARVGQELLAVNRGGEDHTFTEVEEFGGGIIPDLKSSQGCRSRHRSAWRWLPATSCLPAGPPPMTSKRRAPSYTSAASTRGCARS